MGKTGWKTVPGELVIPGLNNPWSEVGWLVTSCTSGPGSFVGFGLSRYRGWKSIYLGLNKRGNSLPEATGLGLWVPWHCPWHRHLPYGCATAQHLWGSRYKKARKCNEKFQVQGPWLNRLMTLVFYLVFRAIQWLISNPWFPLCPKVLCVLQRIYKGTMRYF